MYKIKSFIQDSIKKTKKKRSGKCQANETWDRYIDIIQKNVSPVIDNNFKLDAPYKLVSKYVKPIYIVIEG